MSQKRKNWISNIIIFIVSILSISSISISIIYIIKQQQKNHISIATTPNDWTGIPDTYKEFSTKNSFRVEMDCYKKSHWSQGTAWSWYYEEVAEKKYSWYLMTNFHVVNYAVAYVNNQIEEKDNSVHIKNETLLKTYYENNFETKYNNYGFRLSIFENGIYKNLLNEGNQYIKNISIFTDFNNNGINLFSDSNNNYNLDIALIKIDFDFSKSLSNNWQKYAFVPNVWEIYHNYNAEQKANHLFTTNNIYTYIAGHPAAQKQLTGALLNNETWLLRDEKLNSNDILNDLKAPYYFSENYYENFGLSEGASGSAVYQMKTLDTNLNNLVPIGIYWGGWGKKEILFSPSVIPFFYKNKYNIFDNFQNTFLIPSPISFNFNSIDI